MQARAPVASRYPLNQMSKIQPQRYIIFPFHKLLTCKTCRHAFLAKDSWDRAPCSKSLVSSRVGLECMALPRSIKHDTADCASWGLLRMTSSRLLMVVLRGYVSFSTNDPHSFNAQLFESIQRKTHIERNVASQSREQASIVLTLHQHQKHY